MPRGEDQSDHLSESSISVALQVVTAPLPESKTSEWGQPVDHFSCAQREMEQEWWRGKQMAELQLESGAVGRSVKEEL